MCRVDSDAELRLTDEESASGFSVQTLGYPDSYELPKLGSTRKRRLERAVALVIDGSNRIKRCRGSEGYVHEVLDGDNWRENRRFAVFRDVLDSDIYSSFIRKELVRQETPEECD